MKAARIIVLILMLIILLAGCAEKDKPEAVETAGSIGDYFPMAQNQKYIYTGTGNEFAGYTVYTDYTSKNRIQQRVENGGTVLVRVYEINDGKLTMLLSKGEVYYREDMLQKTDGTDEVMLMEPLVKGTAWSLKDGGERTITGTDAEVSTPLGTFLCIEVITEGKDGTTVDYYAKDIGLVKTIFRNGGMEVTSTLETIGKDTAMTQTVRIYIPDIADGRIYFDDREVSYRTNDVTGNILEAAYKNAINEVFGQVLSEDTVINSLSLDDENMTRVDFNASLTEDMNAVTDYETLILQCIANTLGSYYNSDRVILTVDGEPYRSERIQMAEGESIPVKLEGITEKKLSEIY